MTDKEFVARGAGSMTKRGAPDSVRRIEVIRVECLRGLGTLDDPLRIVLQYWDPESGELLAERDTWQQEKGKQR